MKKISDAEQIESLRAQVPFLHGSTIIRDLRGHSRVPCFVVEKNGQKYFAKLYPGNREQNLQDIEATYLQLQIPTAKTVEIKYLSPIDATFCAYEYIEGGTFAELLPKLPLAQVEDFGVKVGQEVKKFLSATGDQVETRYLQERDESDRVETRDFQEQLDLELSQLLQNLRQQKQLYNQRHTEGLPEIDLARFERSLQKLKQDIFQLPPNFAHTDLNLTNIIFSQNWPEPLRDSNDTMDVANSRPVFVDTDGSKMAFRALDFRGVVWWNWDPNLTTAEVQREQAACRGIFCGMFDDKIPASWHQELSFTMMYEFLIRVQKYAGDDTQTHYSFLRWRENLRQTRYFEDYHFPWF